ncbi:hypothetical protein D3C87_1889870 [compost metagenome]
MRELDSRFVMRNGLWPIDAGVEITEQRVEKMVVGQVQRQRLPDRRFLAMHFGKCINPVQCSNR